MASRGIRSIGATCMAAALALCTAAGIGAQEPLRAYAVQINASSLWVVTHRAGLLGFLGHDHAIIPMHWTATLCAADPIPPSAHGSVVIRTASLVIDSDSARALAGLGDGPSASDRREMQARLLDHERLDAASHPEIVLRVDSVVPEGEGRITASGTLTLRSVTRVVSIPLAVERGPGGRLTFVGKLSVRQRDFGIEPESVARVVNVADEVDLHMRLSAIPTGEACDARASATRGSSPPGRHDNAGAGA